MTEDQLDLLRKAGDSLAAARVLLEHGFSGYAAARAYYAMFYVAEAFLEGEGASFDRPDPAFESTAETRVRIPVSSFLSIYLSQRCRRPFTVKFVSVRFTCRS